MRWGSPMVWGRQRMRTLGIRVALDLFSPRLVRERPQQRARGGGASGVSILLCHVEALPSPLLLQRAPRPPSPRIRQTQELLHLLSRQEVVNVRQLQLVVKRAHLNRPTIDREGFGDGRGYEISVEGDDWGWGSGEIVLALLPFCRVDGAARLLGGGERGGGGRGGGGGGDGGEGSEGERGDDEGEEERVGGEGRGGGGQRVGRERGEEQESHGGLGNV